MYQKVMRLWFLFLFLGFSFSPMSFAQVLVGLDRLFVEECFTQHIAGKTIVLISHHAAINAQGEDALSLFLAKRSLCSLVRLCTLEHGYYGSSPADTITRLEPQGILVTSLYNMQDIPPEVVQDSDLLVYDVQDIGVRSYTFISVLFRLVKASETYHKRLLVLDRPNPMGGEIIDGPIAKFGDHDAPAIPYCYGMTPGELALFFQRVYAPKADVCVVPMKGWKRSMSFEDTGCIWIPPSPQIPDAQSAFFYATTGILGALSITSIGVGYTLPFKVLGAPWMDGERVARELNRHKLPGVVFLPFYYEPFFGKYKMELCSGVLLVLKNPRVFLPVETQCTILGVLKNLYPKEIAAAFLAINKIPVRRTSICRIIGDERFLHICQNERYIMWPLRKLCVEARTAFHSLRAPSLIADYAEE